MKIISLAKWFLNKNPQLCYGYIDENTKLNKLLYFSCLMYYSVNGEQLTDDKFEKWDNGPVSRQIYKEYRYNDLNRFVKDEIKIDNENILKVLEVVNFVYSNKTAKELSDETHKHSIWIDAEKNQNIDFEKISETEKNMMKNIYKTYCNMDFNNIAIEKIGGNIYYYDKRNLEMSDENVSILENMNFQNETLFVETIDGEMVFS